MSHTQPEEAHHVKKGSYLMLKGHPCKVVETKTSKTGKHGHAKCNITGVDCLTSRKYNEVHPGHIILQKFDLVRTEYQVSVLNEDGAVDAMDDEGTEVQFSFLLGKDDDVQEALFKDLNEKINDPANEDKFWVIIVTTAPVGEGDNCKLESRILEIKEGKD